MLDVKKYSDCSFLTDTCNLVCVNGNLTDCKCKCWSAFRGETCGMLVFVSRVLVLLDITILLEFIS